MAKVIKVGRFYCKRVPEFSYAGFGSCYRLVRCTKDGKIRRLFGRPLWLDGKPDRDKPGPGGRRCL